MGCETSKPSSPRSPGGSGTKRSGKDGAPEVSDLSVSATDIAARGQELHALLDEILGNEPEIDDDTLLRRMKESLLRSVSARRTGGPYPSSTLSPDHEPGSRTRRSSGLRRASINKDQLINPVFALERQNSSYSKQGMKRRSKAMRQSIMSPRPTIMVLRVQSDGSLPGRSFEASNPGMPELVRQRTSGGPSIGIGVTSKEFTVSVQTSTPSPRPDSAIARSRARTILEEKVKNENDGFLSIQNGFMPREAPLKCFLTDDERLVAWDDLANRTRKDLLTTPSRFRQEVDSMECFPVDALTDKELLRASSVLGTILQTYWYCGGDRREPRKDLLRAWGAIRKRLKWHVEDEDGNKYFDLPFFTLIDYSTYNWRHEDIEGLYDADTLTMERMSLNVYQTPPVDRSETIFYSGMALIIARGAKLPILCVEAQEAAARKDDDCLANALINISKQWEMIIDVFSQINPHHGAGMHRVDAVMFSRLFADTAIPMPLTRTTSEGKNIVTPSTGQSVPLFQLMDYFFNRKVFTGQQGEDVARHVAAYPRRWRDFIYSIRDPDGETAAHVDDYIRKSGNLKLQGLFTHALQTYAGENGFLGRHLIKMYGYMAMLFRTGREATMGGFKGHPLDRTEDRVGVALQTSQRERFSNRPGEALRHVAKIHEKAIPLGTGDTSMWSVVLDVQNQGLRCSLGDHLCVIPTNLTDIAEKFCILAIDNLDLDADDEVEPKDLEAWKQTLNYFLGELAPECPRLADIALYGDVRPILSELSGDFDGGQLITMEELENIRPLIPRLYSISVIQTDENGDVAFLYVTIREWTNGVASRLLIRGQPGSKVFVQIYRSHVLRHLSDCRTLYFASGSGISPFTNFYSDNKFPREQWLIWMTKHVSNDLRSDFKFISRYNQKLKIDALQTESHRRRTDDTPRRRGTRSRVLSSTSTARRSIYHDSFGDSTVVAHNYTHHDLEGLRGERLMNFFYPEGQYYEKLKSWISSDLTILACGNIGFVMEVVRLLQNVFKVDVATWVARGRLRVECFGSPGSVGSYRLAPSAPDDGSTSGSKPGRPQRRRRIYTPWDVLRSALPSLSDSSGNSDTPHQDIQIDSSPLMVLGRNVYRLTANILNIHPGGKDLILLYQGTDGTAAFEAVGHDKNGNAMGMLQACEVGSIQVPSLSYSEGTRESFDVVRLAWDCAEMRNCHLLDDSLHERIQKSKVEGTGNGVSPTPRCEAPFSERFVSVAISTHRRVIHVHYPRLVSLVRSACQEYCPGILHNWNEDEEPITSENTEEENPVWMGRSSLSSGIVPNTASRHTAPIPLAEANWNDVRARDRAFLASCVWNAANLCEAIGIGKGDPGTVYPSTSSNEAKIEEILTCWKGELQSFITRESTSVASINV